MTTEQRDAQRAAFERLIEGHGGPALSLRLRKNEDGTYHWAETQELFAMFLAGSEWRERSTTTAAGGSRWPKSAKAIGAFAQETYEKALAEGEATKETRMPFLAGVGWAAQELSLKFNVLKETP